MTFDEGEILIRKISQVTEKIFRQQGGIDPMFHFMAGDGEEMIFQVPLGPDVKDAVAEFMRGILAEAKAKWVVMICEAWMVHAPPGTKNRDLYRGRDSLEHHPDREETLMYQLESEDIMMGGKQTITRPPDAKPIIGKLIIEKSRETEGRFVGLLPRGKSAS